MNIIDLITDKNLLGEHFDNPSWDNWKALLKAFYGLPMDDIEHRRYKNLTKRDSKPAEPFNELWLVIGRRGAKSRMAGLIAVYEALFVDHESRLSAGEVATILVLANDRKQARTVFRYIQGFIHSNPMFEQLIVKETNETIEFTNRTCIEIATSSFRSTRGYTMAAVICDEIAFWRTDDSANPDAEIIQAIRPALTTLNGKLIALSSPYSRRGELYRNYQKYFGSNDPSVLVAQAPTTTMNPTIPKRIIDDAKERDLPSALAEYEAQFRNDIESFIDVEQLAKLTRSEPPALPYDGRFKYYAYVDPNGGGADGFSMAIAHKENNLIVVDLVTERIKMNPANVVREYCTILRKYFIHEVTGDRFSGHWVEQEFLRHGIKYNFSKHNRTELYSDFLSVANSGSIELPPTPNDKLLKQFNDLERRTTRSGRDIIDHSPGTHDDLSNAVAGVASLFNKSQYLFITGIRSVC